MLEKIERERKKREEKEKLKLLEKLEAQVIKKKKLNHILKNSSTANTESYNTTKEPSHKRLIDSLNASRKTPHDNFMKIDEKMLDDSGFRKTIRKEKIEILCENNSKIEENFFCNTESEAINSLNSKNENIPSTKNSNCHIVIDTTNSEEILEKEFLANLSKEKKKFFFLKLSEVYEFLSSIKLVRYIEAFIEDGIEDLECILGK